MRDSVSVTATDALKKSVIDFIAADLDEVLAKADGREVELGDKTKVKVRTADAEIVRVEPGIKHRLIMRLADPNIAYMLMIVGFPGHLRGIFASGADRPGAGRCCLLPVVPDEHADLANQPGWHHPDPDRAWFVRCRNQVRVVRLADDRRRSLPRARLGLSV
ncbi:MAG: hypothetical protein M5R36_20515 [Deltaproteobacteria bacterium]|nr:hypothetical protein [Deltaproteobacteria bacterium]